jgi:hypothetical protein
MLQPVQLGVETLLLQQAGVRPALDDPAVVEDENDVGVLDRRQPMRDHEGRAPGEQVAQAFEHEPLGFGVQTGARLIENQNPGFVAQSASDCAHATRMDVGVCVKWRAGQFRGRRRRPPTPRCTDRVLLATHATALTSAAKSM